MDRQWNAGWLPVAYVDEGNLVWLEWPVGSGDAVRCTVACAAGYHARVVNEARGIDTWAHIRELRRRSNTDVARTS
jgi:hypothetical protein